ncbi:MAG: ATP-binding cassette domain-containing protein [Pseudomonadota bacterium]
MSEYALEVRGLSKSFSGKPAVSDLSFAVREGEITGFLGPNGAGKTTSLRMALGIIQPDAGQSRLFGGPPTLAALNRVGFLPEERGVYRKMTAEAVIILFARLKGVPAETARQRAWALLERFGLADAGRKKIKELSKGMAQKVQIIAALAHEPDFVILDEPFSGLDPVNQAMLEEIVREQAAEGRTILFSTHVMQHAERLCDQIVLVARGRKVFDGKVDEALAAAPRQVIIETGCDSDVAALLAPFGTVEAMTADRAELKGWRVTLAPGSDAQDVLKACVDAQVKLARFEPIRAQLQDAFVELVSRDDPQEAAELIKEGEA